MTSPIPTERDTSVAAVRGGGRVPHPAVVRVLIVPLLWLLPALDWVRSAFALAGAEARSELTSRELDEHLATAPREERYWPTDRVPVVQVPDPVAAAELDGPDFLGVLAFLLALGKVDTAAPVDQVLLHARDRADDIHPRSVHVAASYLEREFVTMVRSVR